MTRVKVCGITTMEDALMAVRLGVDALGFIFAPGPRQVTAEQAREIITAVSPFVKSVGVFVDEREDRIREIRRFCGLDLVQFHGRESPETCAAFMPRSIKAFRVRDRSVLTRIPAYRGAVRAILLDGYAEGLRGGTGRTFEWDIAARAREIGLPIILAGGLNPQNIREAVRGAAPHAVDVNSGVEYGPGKKDPALLERLVREVRDLEGRGSVWDTGSWTCGGVSGHRDGE